MPRIAQHKQVEIQNSSLDESTKNTLLTYFSARPAKRENILEKEIEGTLKDRCLDVAAVFISKGLSPDGIIAKIYELSQIIDDEQCNGKYFLADCYKHIGDYFFQIGDYAKPHEFYQKAWALFKEIKDKLPKEKYEKHNLVSYCYNLGEACATKPNDTNAEKYYQLALEISLHDKNDDHALDCYHALAPIYISKRDYVNAEKCERNAIALLEKIHGEKRPDLSRNNYFRLAAILYHKNDLDDANFYQEKGLALSEKTQNKSPLDEASYLSEYGKLYLSKWELDNAKKYYQLALAKYKTLGDEQLSNVADCYHMIGKIYSLKRELDKAERYYKKSLQIKIKMHERDPTHSLGTRCYSALSDVYSQQGDYKKAIEYQEKALEILEVLYKKNDDEVCDAYQDLAEYYTEYGMAKTETETEKETALRKATSLYEMVLEIDNKFIAENFEKLDSYHFIEHNRLLNKLANVYRLQGTPEKAAQLYRTKAIQLYQKLPILALNYIKIASTDYAYLADKSEEHSDLYHIRATLYHQQHRYSAAIKNLKKAIHLNPKANWQTELLELEKEQQNRATQLEPDIDALLERCADSYYTLLENYLNDFVKNNTLSEQSKNLTTELFVAIRTILDITYNRFIRQAIYLPNQEEGGDMYYPFAGSLQGLINELTRRRVIISKKLISENKLELEKMSEVFKVTLAALEQHAYLDKQGVVTDKINKDPNLISLGIEFDPIRHNLYGLLSGKVGQKLEKGDLGRTLNLKAMIPPNSKDIYEALKANAYLEAIDEMAEPDELSNDKQVIKAGLLGYKISDKFTPDVPGFALHLGEQFKLFERQIIEKLRKVIADQAKIKSLDEDFPDVYNAIITQQAFYYFREELNQKQPGFWRNSWQQETMEIANDSKHVRLTPQHTRENTTARCGTININNVRIDIDYLETRFYGWSFVNLLTSQVENKLSDSECIALSRKLLRTFREKKYINQQVIIHPLALAVLEAVKRNAPEDEIKKREDAFCAQVKKDLAEFKEVAQFVEPIAKLLIHRTLQRGHVHLEPDCCEHAPGLIEQALIETRKLVGLLSRNYVSPVQKTVVQAAAENIDFAAIKQHATLFEENYLTHIEKMQAAEVISLDDLKRQHLYLKKIAATFRTLKQPQKAGEYYHKAAKALAETYPWLALEYYQKAIKAYSKTDRSNVNIALLSETGELYYREGMLLQAIEHLYIVPQLQRDEQFKERLQVMEKEYDAVREEVDDDILSQFEHIQIKFQQLKYLCFKLSCDVNQTYLAHTIHTAAVEIIIKLRHLLDQAFSRFVKSNIYWPNQNDSTDIHYPCAGSESRLDELLREAEIINDKDTFASLKQFKEVYNAIVASQAFTFNALTSNQTNTRHYQSSWLDKLVAISNEAKHIRLTLPTRDQLSERLNHASTIDDFYPIHWKESFIYDWSFAALLGGLNQSKQFVGVLKKNKYVENDGSIKHELFKKLASDKTNPLRRQAVESELKKLFPSLTSQTLGLIIDKMLQCIPGQTNTPILPLSQWASLLPLIQNAMNGAQSLIEVLFKTKKQPEPTPTQMISAESSPNMISPLLSSSLFASNLFPDNRSHLKHSQDRVFPGQSSSLSLVTKNSFNI